jgi:ATP-binding cassette, subfamily B (MDR/TAP), member 1
MNAAGKILDLLDGTPLIDNQSKDGEEIVSADERLRRISFFS